MWASVDKLNLVHRVGEWYNFSVNPYRVTVRALPLAAMALLLLIVVAIFQLFLRYEYVSGHGTKWRIDRVTGQVCQMHGERPACDRLRRRPSGDATASLSP